MSSNVVRIDEEIPGATVRVAVADSSSEALGSLVGRLGYDYLIRRPVHPEILRLLFQQLLYRGENTRLGERQVAGWPVQLRLGWRGLPATLLDLSSGGARILTRSEVPVLAEVQLRLPRSSYHGPLALAGRVVRKRLHDDGTWSLALRFLQEVEPGDLVKLRSRLEVGTVGPAFAPLAPLADRLRAWWRGRAQRASELVAPLAPPDRRRIARAVLDTAVLDPDSLTPRNVLTGRDLSVGGLRVDPHPDLAAGDRLRLALFDATGAPLEISGHLVRDDGERGMVFEFENLDGATAARLDALVQSLPAVEQLEERASRGVVFAQIVTARGRPSEA